MAGLEQDLERFRREWRAEVAHKRPQPPSQQQGQEQQRQRQLSPPRTAADRQQTDQNAEASAPAIGSGETGLEEQLEHVQLHRSGATETHASPMASASKQHGGPAAAVEAPRQEEPTSAVELYALAVSEERQGKLNDALSHYRAAFRLDDDVDKAYQRSAVQGQVAGPYSATSTPPNGSKSHADDDDAFSFERTVQVGPDYAGRSATSAHEGSTEALLTGLLKSIITNPYVKPEPAAAEPTGGEHEHHVTLSTEPAPRPPGNPPAAQTSEAALAEARDSTTFLPEDEERPSYFSLLPPEIIHLILEDVLLTSSQVPSVVRQREKEREQAVTREAALSGTGAGGGASGKAASGGHHHGPRARAAAKRAQTQSEAELWGDPDREHSKGWATDVESLERFARTCRRARILTLQTSLWRDLCRKTYVPPQVRDANAAMQAAAQERFAADYRHFFIEVPRIRQDGAYIAVVTYLRRGEGSSWYAPSHLITFYRYLRFHPSGAVLSLLTVEPPSTVVRQLSPTMHTRGLTIGKWRLRGDHVECWGLEDPTVDRSSRKYSLQMTCRLRSTARGRMNKLDLVSLSTHRRADQEVEDVPIRPIKPFYFSKVAAYARDW